MKVKVKFFAILRERAGTAEVIKDVPEGSTVADVWAMLQRDYPKLSVPGIRMLYAVNQSYVAPESLLKDGDEVVFIPPVSGGRDVSRYSRSD
jgi:molybdopterin converting factor subunit 1